MNHPSESLSNLEPVIHALATAVDISTVRQILAANPMLLHADIDQFLSERLQAAWSQHQIDAATDLLACRAFLARCYLHGVEPTLAQPLPLPLASKSSFGQLCQLSHNPSDLPARALHARQALAEVQRSSAPDLWATLHRTLADSLAQSTGPQRAEELEEALASFRRALSVWDEPPFVGSTMRAQTLHAYATTLCRRVKGNKITNLKVAIQLYEKALSVRTQQVYPNEWAETQHELGKAWFALPSKDRTTTIRKAIHHYSNALSVRTQPHYQWAQTAHDLAIAWSENPTGNRGENLDKTIKLCLEVQRILTAKNHPLEWARSQIALANAYLSQLHGDRSANLERALDACVKALSILPDSSPDWARAHYTLAVTFRHRPIGNKTDNFTKSIEHAESALSVFKQTTYPIDWAHVQTGLGNVSSQSETAGSRVTNLEIAIQYYNSALEVRTEDQDPVGWATIQNNLGNTYADRILGDRVANQEMALTCYRNALKQRTRQVSAARWAETMNNLGTLYLERLSGDQEQNQQQAIHCLRLALEVHTPDLYPNDSRRAAKNLANLLLAQEQWGEAATYYIQALTASEYLYQASATTIARDAELRETSGLAARLTYAIICQDDQSSNLTNAVIYLERNRARWLTESLALLSEKPLTVPDDVWRSFTVVAAQIQQQTTFQLPDNTLDRSAFLDMSTELAMARTKLSRHIEQIRTYAPTFMPTPNFTDIQLAFTSEIGIYLLTAVQGGFAIIVHAGHVTSVRLDRLTEEALMSMLRRWFTAYDSLLHQRSEINQQAWFNQIDDITHLLWDSVVGPITLALEKLDLHSKDYDRPPVVTLIPSGLLALLPLHSAWTEESNNSTGRRYFLDDYAVCYAPSATALRHCHTRLSNTNIGHLFALDEPKPIKRGDPLPNSAREVKAIASLFPAPTVLQHEQASREATLNILAAAQVAHFSCHGMNNWQNPLGSGLLLANDELLTVRDFLELQLPSARLATLSACETGIVGTDLPDEVLMLPSALVQAGYAGVVASLWSVADVSTAMLMVRFYQFWREEGLEPVYALRAAQRWVRDTTNGEKAAYFGQFVPSPENRMAGTVAAEFFNTAMLSTDGLEVRSFAHPFWWGAFYLTGV